MMLVGCLMPVETTQLEMLIRQGIIDMDYAVRGPIVARAMELESEGGEIIWCNIGNPQQLGQKPLTYIRQTHSLIETPELIGREYELRSLETRLATIPEDILQRAEGVVQMAGDAGTGAYTVSSGFDFVRKAVAAFIDRRDGFEPGSPFASDPKGILITDGASGAARYIFEMLLANDEDAAMIPVPAYPLYAALAIKDGKQVASYRLNEQAGWHLDAGTLEHAYSEARGAGKVPRLIVAIDPSNPVRKVFTREEKEYIVSFAEEHGLAIVGDEVYQENGNGGFVSFAQVLGDRRVPLFSLHSTSKGIIGECGKRGGYVEIRNPPLVANKGDPVPFMDLIEKEAAVFLCSNTVGQITVYSMVTPPVVGDASYDLYHRERAAILGDFDEKRQMMIDAFGQMDGVTEVGDNVGMYLFPHLGSVSDDNEYCRQLLEKTGLCAVPGTGFGYPGHLRVALLPAKDQLAQVLPQWIEFHNEYVNGAH